MSFCAFLLKCWQAEKHIVGDGKVAVPNGNRPAPADGKTTTTWAPKADERDRIDFIYVPETGTTSKEAWVVGPSPTFVNTTKVADPGSDAFLASDLSWPSDHKGVLVALALAPAL